MSNEVDRLTVLLAAREAECAELRAALAELGPIVRGLGEHGVQIVLESEAADGARWVGDPAFVTKLKEVIRIYGNGAADIVEKRVAALLSRPSGDYAALRAMLMQLSGMAWADLAPSREVDVRLAEAWVARLLPPATQEQEGVAE